MNLTAEQREQVATELKRFAADLNLNEVSASSLLRLRVFNLPSPYCQARRCCHVESGSFPASAGRVHLRCS